MAASLMKIKKISQQGITYPFGDHRSVMQAFPAGVDTNEADPFLMCDYFNGVEKDGPVKDPDDFPVGWHPHRGFDIASYFRSGVGRHGDSLGNRETFSTPGMQWMSVGSGVEHAEGGANPKGARYQGFQIWVNVPSVAKMEDPDYGTVPSEDLPLRKVGDIESGVAARILAGKFAGHEGPFRTKQSVQMIDFEVEPSRGDNDPSNAEFEIAKGLDTAILYIYEGGLLVNGELTKEGSIVLFDANDDKVRGIKVQSEPTLENGGKAMLFAGKKLKEPIAWRGPIVMNSQQEVLETFQDLRAGRFPPVRVDWDYKRIAAKPSTQSESEL
jgi:quercetin 2,3-dioxygenase